MSIQLSNEQRQKLLSRHRKERDSRTSDRIKAVLWYDEGKSYEEIAKLLFLSIEGVRKQVHEYFESEKISPASGGSEPKLDALQTAELLAHLETHLYIKASDISAYVLQKYGINYSVSGMTAWLLRNNFSFHQPSPVPARANADAQGKFLEYYDNLKEKLPDDDHIVFIDGVHPTHQVRFTRGWIRKGERKEILTNGSHKRLNIIGALNLTEMTLKVQEFETINGEAIITFFVYLLSVIPKGVINIILDRAGYHTCGLVAEWLQHNPRIKLHFLPAHSPNINAIEPAWKIMHEHTTNNLYHPTFKQFSEKIRDFFATTFPQNARNWTDRLTDNFRIIGQNNLA